jgi:hypothetical protein
MYFSGKGDPRVIPRQHKRPSETHTILICTYDFAITLWEFVVLFED